ncbi:MAG TPA: SAM-dependent methyltransferase, partial [Archaeoglobaceae archaeon]|nr:SAM-dependent methyltransferase [Archaeoglobaceae archaeon]
RIKAKEKFGELSDKLFFDDTGLRYSTPKLIAEYRAERLKCDTMADISCGVGAQLLFFARVCRKVYGVEIDRKRALFARLNVKSMGLENVEILEGDALSDEIVRKVKNAEIIFSDPSRPPGEDVRTLNNLEPSPYRVIEKYVDHEIAFELPPQIPPSRIEIGGEKEYTSLNFRLNRLALYTGDLASCNRSAISIPSRERVTEEDRELEPEKSEEIKSYVYEVDTTITKAELLQNLLGKLKFPADIVSEEKKRMLITSDIEVTSEFLRRYEVLEITEFKKQSIIDALRSLNAEKVTLRLSVHPSEYWKLRNEFERELSGERWVFLFKIDSKAVIASRP